MRVPDRLTLEFVLVFARFEFALKRVQRYCKGDEGDRAKADWDQFGEDAAPTLEAYLDRTGQLQGAVDLLVSYPPHREVVQGGVAVFAPEPTLGGGSVGQKLLKAVRRVRNNLLHGGKYQVERYAGHDRAVVEQGLIVLQAAREIARDIERDLHAHLFD
jgi:hypothetical protein